MLEVLVLLVDQHVGRDLKELKTSGASYLVLG